MSSLARRLDRREARLERRDDRRGVVDRQGRLGQERQVVGIGDLERGDIRLGLDQGHRARRDLAERADDLGMAGVADEQ